MEVYSELTALKLDGACKDASRLSFLSHDPEVYFNPEAQAYGMSDVVERRRLKEAAARPAVAENRAADAPRSLRKTTPRV
jgi:hypothetical protein